MDKWTLIALAGLFSAVAAQSPIVTITDTQPERVEDIIEVKQGKDVTMNCFVENLQQGTLVRWQKARTGANGQVQVFKISADTSVEDNTRMSIEKPTYFTWRLRLKSVGKYDSGNYSCFVMTTRQNRREANVTVKVLVPPSLDPERTSWDTVVREGDTIDLNCHASGYPRPTIEWSRLGGALLPIGKEKHFQPVMTIKAVRAEDRGKYRCRAYNTIGMTSRDVKLDVRFRPKVRVQNPVLSQAPGYMIELQCLVIANPFPNAADLRWFKGTRGVSLRGGEKKIQAVEGAFNQMSYELVFNPVREEDYGEYTCQVKNGEGTSSAVIRLERSDTPQPSIKLGRVIVGGAAINLVSAATLIMCLLVCLLH